MISVRAPLTLFCLHFLGGSARSFGWAADRLQGDTPCIPLDLPGFGRASALTATSVAAMADHVTERIRAAAPGRWALLGHSMGAKVAMAVARRSEDGEAGLGGLARLILVSGSPPGPEPMDDAKRAGMLGWFTGTPDEQRRQATGYVRANTASRLPAALEAMAVADVLGCRRSAWTGWLEAGSREDWSAAIGVLHTPALVVVGAEDGDLGAAAQTSLTMPHLAHARLVRVEGAGHLLPLEQPTVLAGLIEAHVRAAEPAAAVGPAIDPAYLALIRSDRVSERLRAALLARAEPDAPGFAPAAMGIALFATLRAVLDRVIPQAAPAIDIAARIDRRLAGGQGDGWRFAALPPDRPAYGAALEGLNRAARTAHGGDFAALDADGQDRLLGCLAAGQLPMAPGGATAAAMALWFEDLRAEAARVYVGHPATLARMGYGGIANGGAADTMQGFVTLGIGAREAWEPVAETRQ